MSEKIEAETRITIEVDGYAYLEDVDKAVVQQLFEELWDLGFRSVKDTRPDYVPYPYIPYTPPPQPSPWITPYVTWGQGDSNIG